MVDRSTNLPGATLSSAIVRMKHKGKTYNGVSGVMLWHADQTFGLCAFQRGTPPETATAT